MGRGGVTMLYPSIDLLTEIADSKYTLVIAASKRARQLLDGQKREIVKPKSFKNVGIALEEIADGKVTFERISKST